MSDSRDALARSVEAALGRMDPLAREVLRLRHVKRRSNTEVAAELGIEESAASRHHLRALRKLREILGDSPGATYRS